MVELLTMILSPMILCSPPHFGLPFHELCFLRGRVFALTKRVLDSG